MFPIETVLTITTGRLLCSMGDVYRILNHMTGDDLMTHQLPRAMEAAAPVLLAEHPQLSAVQVPETADWPVFIAELIARFGAELLVPTLEDWEQRNPIEEAADMIGADRVWVIPMEETGRIG